MCPFDQGLKGMSAFVVKSARAALTYVLDWRAGYLAPRETVIDDLGWSVRFGREAGDLLVVEQHHDFYRSWAEFRAGTPGAFYLISARVRTSRDRVLARTLVMRVSDAARRF
jgi:hypothetical protein